MGTLYTVQCILSRSAEAIAAFLSVYWIHCIPIGSSFCLSTDQIWQIRCALFPGWKSENTTRNEPRKQGTISLIFLQFLSRRLQDSVLPNFGDRSGVYREEALGEPLWPGLWWFCNHSETNPPSSCNLYDSPLRFFFENLHLCSPFPFKRQSDTRPRIVSPYSCRSPSARTGSSYSSELPAFV